MARHIKKGDTVKIIAGDHKGAVGKVLRVISGDNKVVVQGHNLVKKHVRPSQKHPQGGRITLEQPIDISNVLPVTGKDNRPTRVKYEVSDDGSKKRVATDGSEIGVIRRGTKKK